MANNSRSPNNAGSPANATEKSAPGAIVFFLVIALIAALACLVYEHTEYKVAKDKEDTTSSQDLNGQSPANTVGSATGAVKAPPAGAPADSAAPVASGNGGAAPASTGAADAAPAATGSSKAPAPAGNPVQTQTGTNAAPAVPDKQTAPAPVNAGGK